MTLPFGQYVGKVCKYGHEGGVRYETNKACVVCQKERSKKQWLGVKADPVQYALARQRWADSREAMR